MILKRIHPIATLASIIITVGLIYYLGNTGLALKAKHLFAVKVLFCGVILLAVASLVKILYSRNNMGVGFYVVIIIILIIAFICYVGYSYNVSLGDEIRGEHQLALSASENMTLLFQEAISYARKNQGRLPSADNWCDELLELGNVTKETFKNSEIENNVCDFAFNRNISGLEIDSIPKNVIIFFEANGGWNLNGDDKLLNEIHAKRRWAIGVMFVDGVYGEYFFTGNACLEGPEETSRSIRWKP
ncbi:MAG: hypothetical protein WC454_08795 [Phycisphaerae bacterium]|jgi:hypothetical protein